MKFFFQSILKNKNTTLILILALCTSLFSWVDNFRFDASSETLVLEDDLSYELYEQINERFSSSEFLVIALSNDDIFSNVSLANLRTVSYTHLTLPTTLLV